MTITIERLSELYQQGYYSKFDFYLGLIEILAGSDETDRVLDEVPAQLWDDMVEMAEAHYSSAAKAASFDQQKNPEKILRRRHGRPEAASTDNGSPPNPLSKNQPRRHSPEEIIPSTER